MSGAFIITAALLVLSLILVVAIFLYCRTIQQQLTQIQSLTSQQQQASTSSRDTVIKLEGRFDEQGRVFADLRQDLSQRTKENTETMQQFTEKQGTAVEGLKLSFEKRQLEALQALQLTLQKGQESSARLLSESLSKSAQDLGVKVEGLTVKTDQRLQEISGQVEKRLNEGFEKTTATFMDVVKRLALIDEAQKKITELSTNVVSLQQVLSNRQSLGAFGEVQLSVLVRNILPESAFSFQHSLKNGNRADCILFLPSPTGNVVIDSKFPLETYQRMTEPGIPDADRKAAEKQFKIAIKKHITDIASKYIVNGETSDGAFMFVPAESVFAEIHARHRDLVEESYRAKVFITSPTTLVAILTTARAVLKDAATREQVHVIHDHLIALGKDFDRFQARMEKLAGHVRQANEQAEQVTISAQKITKQFRKIEKADLSESPADTSLIAADEEEPKELPQSSENLL